MNRKPILTLGIVLALGGVAVPASAGTYTSGSTGADGAFTAACTPTPCTQTVQLPASGTFNYTTYSIPAGITVKYLKNATNTPLTILTTGNVTLAGTLDLKASPGVGYFSGAPTFPNGGAGGPGGHQGGSGATVIPASAGDRGGTGLGPGGGGGGGMGSSTVYHCNGGGGGFGTAGVTTPAYGTACVGAAIGAGGPAYGHAALLPLLGGSGGGGGGAPFAYTGGSGGGGGGALLLASSGTITLTGSILANGGAGGGTAGSGVGAGGGGAGGGVRLVATTIAGTGGSIQVNGGAGGTSYTGTAPAGGVGRIRLEASTFTATATFSSAPSITVPGSTTLAGNPTLTIASVGGVSAPASPGGAYGSPDITLPNTTTNPVTVSLAASQIPLGTTVAVRVSPQVGTTSSVTSTALAGTLASSTATASVTLPLDQPAVLDASATFTLSAWLDSPIRYAGEEVTTVKVTAALGPSTGLGAGGSRVRYFTASGTEVPAEALLGLGLPR